VKLDAEKVRWHRDRHGWTLETAAEQAEVALGTLLRAEHGEDIRPSSGRRIARAFGVDVSELVPGPPGVVLPKAEAPSSSGQPKIEKAPQVTREQLEEQDIPASEGEISEVNQLLTDYWRQVHLGEKTSGFFPSQTEVDWHRVILLLNYVLNRPDLFGLAPQEAKEIRELVKTA
jgi:transcriptional regulator with XRE-family HTH domain